MTIEAQHIIDALAKQGSDTEFKVRDYSGRGMYGRNCIGIDVDTTGDVMKIAALLIDGGFSTDEIIELGEGMTTDSMGRGMIVYWPGIKLTTEEVAALRKDEDDEDEDGEDE